MAVGVVAAVSSPSASVMSSMVMSGRVRETDLLRGTGMLLLLMMRLMLLIIVVIRWWRESILSSCQRIGVVVVHYFLNGAAISFQTSSQEKSFSYIDDASRRVSSVAAFNRPTMIFKAAENSKNYTLSCPWKPNDRSRDRQTVRPPSILQS